MKKQAGIDFLVLRSSIMAVSREHSTTADCHDYDAYDIENSQHFYSQHLKSYMKI